MAPSETTGNANVDDGIWWSERLAHREAFDKFERALRDPTLGPLAKYEAHSKIAVLLIEWLHEDWSRSDLELLKFIHSNISEARILCQPGGDYQKQLETAVAESHVKDFDEQLNCLNKGLQKLEDEKQVEFHANRLYKVELQGEMLKIIRSQGRLLYTNIIVAE